MDGVLIDSEPLWRIALIAAMREVGVTLTEKQATETQGIRISETIEYWYRKKGWEGQSREEVMDATLDGVTRLIRAEGKPLPGTLDCLKFLSDQKIPLALASSSPERVIDAVLDTLHIRNYFQVIKSARKLAYGKPHPEIFIQTAQELGLPENQCLVIEDSLNGMIAAKAARMKTVVVPESLVADTPGFELADVKIKSLEAFTPALWEELKGA